MLVKLNSVWALQHHRNRLLLLAGVLPGALMTEFLLLLLGRRAQLARIPLVENPVLR